VVLVINQVLIITALQAVLMSVVLRWIPARLARDAAAAIAGLTGVGFYLVWNLGLRQSFSPRRAPDLTNLTTQVQRIDWLPSAWPGHALSAVIDGDLGVAVTWTVLAIAFGVLLVAASELLYARTLLAGLGVFGSVPALWRRSARRQIPIERQGAGSPVRAIARKDWLGYRRDIRRLSRLLPALLFPAGYAFAFIRPSRGVSGFWSEVFVIAFVSMFMSSALGTPSIPSERRGFQLLRMSPLPMWQVIRAKIVLTLPPVLLLTTLFSVIVSVATAGGAAQTLTVVALAIWFGCGFVSIGVSAGGIDPNFEATDDRRSVGLVGTFTGLGGSLGFGILTLGAVALVQVAVAAFRGGTVFGPIPATPAVGALAAVGAVGFVVGAAAIVAALAWIANSRLSRYESAITATV
jgi:putative ABC exporter